MHMMRTAEQHSQPMIPQSLFEERLHLSAESRDLNVFIELIWLCTCQGTVHPGNVRVGLVRVINPDEKASISPLPEECCGYVQSDFEKEFLRDWELISTFGPLWHMVRGDWSLDL